MPANIAFNRTRAHAASLSRASVGASRFNLVPLGLTRSMDTEALLAEIDVVFPDALKPEGLDISFHKDDCAHCYCVREYLADYSGPALPDEVIRYLWTNYPAFQRWEYDGFYLPICAYASHRRQLTTRLRLSF